MSGAKATTRVTPAHDQGQWFLEGFSDQTGVLRRIPIRPVPFQVGRKYDLPLALNFPNISRIHAELYFERGRLVVKDLDSRNGTFVNRERISSPTILHPGDVLHFGSSEFRVAAELDETSHYFSDTLEFQGVLPEKFALGTREFLDMLHRKAVVPFFQPLVRMDTGEVFAHELLGRGGMPGVPTSAPELFALAAGCSMEGELSKLFRTVGLQVCSTRKECRELFVNVHPAEMRDLDELARQLGILQEQYPKLQLTVEIHESLVTNPAAIQQFRAALAEHSIKIAYDDFGAGQARLMELVESPPDYLKFDRSLVENIHMAQRHRRQMVEMLVRYASNLGVTTLAEGVEMREEAAVCKEIGFHCAQGFYFGRPQPLGDLTTTM